MITNHPAHGPVSLDRLHQISEILSKASAQSDGGNLGYAMADAVKVIDGSIASFGAEPVLYAAEETLAYAKMGELHLKCLSQPMGEAVIPLYRRAAMLKHQSSNHASDSNVSGCEINQPSSNSFTDEDLEMMAHGDNPQSNAYRELLAFRRNFREIPNSSTNNCREISETSTNSAEMCWCLTCRPVTMNDMRFVVCPECGNKRCPHANDHRHSCSGSNAPCQEGSAYPAAPQQEVKP